MRACLILLAFEAWLSLYDLLVEWLKWEHVPLIRMILLLVLPMLYGYARCDSSIRPSIRSCRLAADDAMAARVAIAVGARVAAVAGFGAAEPGHSGGIASDFLFRQLHESTRLWSFLVWPMIVGPAVLGAFGYQMASIYILHRTGCHRLLTLLSAVLMIIIHEFMRGKHGWHLSAAYDDARFGCVFPWLFSPDLPWPGSGSFGGWAGIHGEPASIRSRIRFFRFRKPTFCNYSAA